MNSSNVFTIARYESKMYRRSWLFKLFGFMTITLVLLLIILTQTTFTRSTYWNMVALSCSIPLACCYLLSIIQSIFIIFSMDAFSVRTRRIDSAEVMLTRQIGNEDFVVGKLLGILKTIFLLDIVIILFAIGLNLFASESPFNLTAYFFYFITLVIPSLLFISGLAAFVTLLTRNQALALAILVGYYFLSLIYLATPLQGVFNFTGSNLSNTFSHITGHTNLLPYLNQRLSIFLIGLSLILLSVILYRRLPNSANSRPRYRAIGLIVLFLGFGCSMSYLVIFQHKNHVRQTYAKTYIKYQPAIKANLLAQEITIEPSSNHLSAEAQLTVKNENPKPISQIILYLNPGLEIDQITRSGSPISFKRENQVILIEQSLEPDQKSTFTIAYSGNIDENICYPEISPEEYYDNSNSNNILRHGKKFAFLNNECILLTPESQWYPTTIPPVNILSPYHVEKNFSDYTLHVKVPAGQTAISSGETTQAGNTTTFTNNQALPFLSLCIGNYEKKSMMVDSVAISLYYFKENDFFSAHFIEITEEDMAECIKEEMAINYGFPNGKKFPFLRLNLVETPVAFSGFDRTWKGNSEMVQPELIFLQEKGNDLLFSNIASYKNFGDPKNIDPEVDEKELETRAFIRILCKFTDEYRDLYRENLYLDKLLKLPSKRYNTINQISLTPLYYNFVHCITSEEYPGIDIIINKILRGEKGSVEIRRGNQSDPLIDYLGKHSLEEALNDKTLSPKDLDKTISLKSRELQNLIAAQTPAGSFMSFIHEYARQHRFQHTTFKNFHEEFYKKYEIDILPIIHKWYKSSELPYFHVGEFRRNEVIDHGVTKYQFCIDVFNPSKADGVIQLGTNTRKLSNSYVIKAGTCKEIKVIYDEAYIFPSINTGIALNIPSGQGCDILNMPCGTAKAEEGLFDADPSIFDPDPNEIIVDDMDPGFRIIALKSPGFLHTLFNGRDAAIGSRWKIEHSSVFHGKVAKQAYTKQSGNGEEEAEWKTDITIPGKYEVFVHNSSASYRDDDGKPVYSTYIYSVTHADGSEEIEKEMNEPEWISLGKFNFKAGTAIITLKDKTKDQYDDVVADAVKWVRIAD